MDFAINYKDFSCERENVEDKPTNCKMTQEDTYRAGANSNKELTLDAIVKVPEELRRITVTFTQNMKSIAEIDFCAGHDEMHINNHAVLGNYEGVGEWAKGTEPRHEFSTTLEIGETILGVQWKTY